MSATPALDQLVELTAELDRLHDLDPIERALAARDLYGRVHAAVAAVRDEAVCCALLEVVDGPRGPRRRTYRLVADELGMEVTGINSVVTRYRNWVKLTQEGSGG